MSTTQFDPQPVHLDERQAQKTFFRGLAASGRHTASIAMRLLMDGVPLAGGVIGAMVEELRRLKPVRPGDVLGLESEVLDIQPGDRPRAKENHPPHRIRILEAELLRHHPAKKRGTSSCSHAGAARAGSLTVNSLPRPAPALLASMLPP